MRRDELLVYIFAGMLVDERVARGVGQARLAAQMGISASYLNVVEKGKRRSPTDEWLIRWGVALALSDDEIAGYLDLAKAARFAWQRWTRACRLDGVCRDEAAAYRYVESLITGAEELDVLGVRQLSDAPTPEMEARPASSIPSRRPGHGTLVIQAAYIPSREAAM